MPGRRPKRDNSKKADTSRNTASSPPPSSEDAKPPVEQLNAALEAEDEAIAQVDTEEDAADVRTRRVGTPEPVELPRQHGLPISQDSEETATSPVEVSPATRGRGRGGRQPRGQRRSQAAREELIRAAEEQRKADLAAAKRSQNASSARGRGRADGNRRGGRGQGGFMGQSDRSEQAPADVSGPFSAGIVHKDSRHIKRAAPSSGWTGLGASAPPRSTERPTSRRSWSQMGERKSGSGGSTGKSKAGSSADVKPVLDKDGDVQMERVDGGYISSDDEGGEDGLERVDVNDFGLVDLTGDDDADRGFYNPVRIRRIQHKERTFGINAEGATNQDGEIAVDANDVAAVVDAKENKRSKQSASNTHAGTQQKQAFQAVYSDSDDNLVQSDPQIKVESEAVESIKEQPPASQESKRKGKERLRAARATSPAVAVPGSDYHTQEDIEEWARQQEDLRIIHAELGDIPTDANGGTATTNGQTNPDKRADKVYLFQFPPVLPDLLPETSSVPTNGETDPMHIDPQADDGIKLEPSTSTDETKHPPPSALPSGAVGKLNVHASGKVTLDWGGTAMTLGLGTEAGFLQDLMLTTLPDKKVVTDVEASNTVLRGEAVGFGRVRGKFVVVPDWEGILD